MTRWPTNLVLVFADQMRGQAMGCAGNRQVSTPNLDRLAAEGVLFRNAIANTPVCTPSRGTLLTGLSPLAHGALTNDIAIRNDVPALGTILRDAGYRTGYIGKWHLGGVPRDRFVPPGTERLGFDHYWAAWNCHHQYFHARYHLDTEKVRTFEGYEPDEQTELTVRFIERHRNDPFALVVSFGPPHAPYEQVPDRFLSMYSPEKVKLRANVTADSPEQREGRRKVMAQYYAAITALDANVGRLLQALQGLNLDERTLVVFTSDHGDMLGSQGMVKKEQPWEESIRVPLLMRCPRLLPSAKHTKIVTGIMDLAPTVLDLLQVEIPATMEGRSVAPLLIGAEGDPPASVPIGIHVPVDQAVAQGISEWRGVRTERYTYARRQTGDGWLLYDNAADPFQKHNLIDDPGAQPVKRALEGELQRWLEQLHDPFLPWPDMVRRAGLTDVWNVRERYMHPDNPRLVS
jgi:arylsulfatase A-like enzyme